MLIVLVVLLIVVLLYVIMSPYLRQYGAMGSRCSINSDDVRRLQRQLQKSKEARNSMAERHDQALNTLEHIKEVYPVIGIELPDCNTNDACINHSTYLNKYRLHILVTVFLTRYIVVWKLLHRDISSNSRR